MSQPGIEPEEKTVKVTGWQLVTLVAIVFGAILLADYLQLGTAVLVSMGVGVLGALGVGVSHVLGTQGERVVQVKEQTNGNMSRMLDMLERQQAEVNAAFKAIPPEVWAQLKVPTAHETDRPGT